MHSSQIQKLLNSVVKKYGGFEYYGSSPAEEYGTCFKLQGISATFSVVTNDGELKDSYDVQIEGIPPGEYLYTCEASLPDFMDILSKYEGPEEEWP